MTHIDDAIRQALSAEDVRALDAFSGEQSALEQAFATLGGRFRWINTFGLIVSFALFGLGVFCVWKLIAASDLRETVLWGTATVVIASGLGLLKIWFWVEMQKNAVVREVKRLELQVARLAARLPV